MLRPRRFHRLLARLLLALAPLRPRMPGFGPAIALGATLVACMSPMTPAAKLNETVQETNMALRFGRNDLAMERVFADARTQFIKAHKSWGTNVQIVDMELGGLEKMGEKEAIVLVGFSWFRPSEGRLRNTIVRQTWKSEGSGPWMLANEERASGDIGLLNEVNVVVVVPEKKDQHFETKTIPGN